MRVGRQRSVQGDDVARRQEVVERQGRGAAVVDEQAAAEAREPVDHGRADAADPHDADREFAELPPALARQAEVVRIDATDHRRGSPQGHEDEHHGEVGDPVGLVRHVVHGDADGPRVVDVDVVEPDAARGEVSDSRS